MRIKNKVFNLNPPYIHYICTNETLMQIIDDIENDEFVCSIEGSKCINTEGVFYEFATKLNFPSYFGKNWDAFSECINDLDWINKEAYLIFINDANLLMKEDKKGFEILIEILRNTIKEWTEGRYYNPAFPTNPIPFHIVFQFPSISEEIIGFIENIIEESLDYIT